MRAFVRGRTRSRMPQRITHRPPRDIADNTAARRAWLAAKLAERNAAGAIDARIVGKGSYQTVSERTPSATPTLYRKQLRGLCSCCLRAQAIEASGGIAAHGYRVPQGWGGMRTSQCYGSNFSPLATSCGGTESLLEHVRRRREWLRTALQEQTLDAVTARDYRREVDALNDMEPQLVERIAAYHRGEFANTNRTVMVPERR